MACTLYTYPKNYGIQKSLIAAQYSGTVVNVPLYFHFGETNKFQFPDQKVPILRTPDDKYLSESNAIAYYVGNDQLNGKTQLERAEILMWINFADSELHNPASTWIFPCLGLIQYNKQSTEKAKEDIKRVLGVLNSFLLSNTYFVGERITQADITLCCTLLSLYQLVLEPSFRHPYQSVNRWFTTCVNQPEFKAVLGDVVLCDKMTQFDDKKFAEVHNKIKPAKEREETLLNPFATFPKGTFNMEKFKQIFINGDENVSIKYFWKNFDAENYSVWYCEYICDEDRPLVVMSRNLIGGMFNMADKMRKYAFARICIFGENSDHTMAGIWVWRGHELAVNLSSDWGLWYTTYSWKKLDPALPETKKLVNEYFAWPGDFDGKKFNQALTFK